MRLTSLRSGQSDVDYKQLCFELTSQVDELRDEATNLRTAMTERDSELITSQTINHELSGELEGASVTLESLQQAVEQQRGGRDR